MKLLRIEAKRNQSQAGGDKFNEEPLLMKTTKAVKPINIRKAKAEFAGVSEDTVRKQEKIRKEGTPEQIEDARSGKKKIGTVYREIEERRANEGSTITPNVGCIASQSLYDLEQDKRKYNHLLRQIETLDCSIKEVRNILPLKHDMKSNQDIIDRLSKTVKHLNEILHIASSDAESESTQSSTYTGTANPELHMILTQEVVTQNLEGANPEASSESDFQRFMKTNMAAAPVSQDKPKKTIADIEKKLKGETA